jgi:tetratricopeptide (TPR) repeat protein
MLQSKSLALNTFITHQFHLLPYQKTSLARTALCRFALEDYSTAYADLELALSLSRDGLQSLSDYHQVAEILNTLGCLAYMGGEIDRAMSFFRQSTKVLTKAEGLALYSDGKFDSYSTMLALSIAKSNIAFLSLTFYREVKESVATFESVVKDQQLLFRDHQLTLISTMEHLAAANLLAGHKDKSLQMLRRVLQIQACGGDAQTDDCQRTRHKIAVLEGKEDIGDLAAVGSNILPILETSRENSSSS